MGVKLNTEKEAVPMKLTGDLKTQVESADTKEEKRELIQRAGMILSDDELDQVAGGMYFRNCNSCRERYGSFACQSCSVYRG